MKELCIPVPGLEQDQIAEVSVTVAGKQIKYEFRVEAFPWDAEHSETSSGDDKNMHSPARIFQLKNFIEKYDKNWQLIQIFTPPENATHIQVLYRKKVASAG